VLAAPRSDALDDEEALARLHVADTSRLTGERSGRVGIRQLALEPQLLCAKQAHLLGPTFQVVTGGQVTTKRLRVEERNERNNGNAEPAQKDARSCGPSPAPTWSLTSHVGHVFRGRDPPSSGHTHRSPVVATQDRTPVLACRGQGHVPGGPGWGQARTGLERPPG
jgi:hypothetical protein